MKITTTYKTNHNGTPQIVAKGGGKQRTVTAYPNNSIERNHGLAAGTLALALFEGAAARKIALETAKVVSRDSVRMEFSVGV